jgi:hypothetical protein
MLEPRRINCGLKKAPPGPFLPLRIRLLEAFPPRLSASFLPQAHPSLLDRYCFPKGLSELRCLAHQGLLNPGSGFIRRLEQGRITGVALAEPSFQIPQPLVLGIVALAIEADDHGGELIIGEGWAKAQRAGADTLCSERTSHHVPSKAPEHLEALVLELEAKYPP